MNRLRVSLLLGASAVGARGAALRCGSNTVLSQHVRPVAMQRQHHYASPAGAFFTRSEVAAVRMMCTEAPPAEAAAPAAAEGPAPFELIDVRVGQIVEAWEHPDSDKLWCEKIDVGEEEPREIASGIRAYYATSEDLVGRKVLVVCNLKAAKLAGFASNGMVLCASSPDRSTVAFVEPPEEAEVGARVLMEGAEAVDPASGNAMKKKKWMEKAAEELRAIDNVACYRGTPLVVGDAGKCTSPTVAEGTIN